jgi:GNAT superfamily N-acetyltransferase
MPDIVEASTQEQLEQVRSLFREYQAQLPVEYRTVQLDHEIESLPGPYAAARGCLLLATVSSQPAGCVGLRPFPLEGAAEIKRLYVRPGFRGYKLGQLLVQRIIFEARNRGYTLLRLDTHPPTMQAAVGVYQRCGFTPVAPVDEAVPGLLYMQLRL